MGKMNLFVPNYIKTIFLGEAVVPWSNFSSHYRFGFETG